MGRQAFSRIRDLDARCPGLIKKVDAMFESFASIEAVTQMVRRQSRQRTSRTTIWKYKRYSWKVRRGRDELMQAKAIAQQTLVNERKF
jgi:hypothetical protein